jgi:hypothetical protein
MFVEEATGCLLAEPAGPRTEVVSSFDSGDYDTSFSGVIGGPSLSTNRSDGRHVQVNPCAGVAQPETWTLTYDRNRQGWEVEGSLSGVLDAVAREGERYLSADGAISFLLLPGVSPSEDGWRITFRVLEGAIVAENDDDEDGSRDAPFDLPSDPTFFQFLAGKEGEQTPRAFVLVAAEGSDRVSRVEPSTGDVEIDWD